MSLTSPRIYRAAALLALAVLPLTACLDRGGAQGGSPTPTANPAGVPTAVVSRSAHPAVRQPFPSGQPVEQSAWVRDRISAVKQIYGFTPTGESWLDGYDFRQMAEQPAWFGSYGYNSWAGAGEATPRSVLHELSHSYWGAFSVEGWPELSWDSDLYGVPAALAQFRRDLDAFLRQPPDRFEPLRDRFRNLPNLTAGGYPDLHHFGEAELINMAGGNLQLLPPILRKYFAGFLSEGGVGPGGGGALLTGWDQALAWFTSLSFTDQRIAGEMFGIQHFPLGVYAGLPATGFNGLDPAVRAAYEQEEKQRLIDFSEQFEGIISREFALVDAAGADRGFDFWRAYLSDKLTLHNRYPDVLPSLSTERASQLAAALDFYSSIEHLSAERQAGEFRAVSGQPFVAELAVLMKPRAIVELFAESSGSSGVLAVLGSRAGRLAGLVNAADRVEAAAGQGAHAGAAELELFLASLPDAQLGSDIFLLLDLLRSARPGLASAVLPALGDRTLLRLLDIAPAAARSPEIGTARLLSAVGIGDASSLTEVEEGATRLAARSSGNFAIDAPYDEAVFTHFDRFVVSDPAGVLRAVTASGMRLIPWTARPSDGAVRAMRGAPDAAVDALLSLPGPRETADRVLHMLARRDARLSAQLAAVAAQREGGEELVVALVRRFAYDGYWSERDAGPGVRPEHVAQFFTGLVDETGMDAVLGALEAAVAGMERDAEARLVEDGGVEAMLQTLSAAGKASTGSVRDLMDLLAREAVAFRS